VTTAPLWITVPWITVPLGSAGLQRTAGLQPGAPLEPGALRREADYPLVTMTWLPLALVVVGNLLYHLGQKTMPRDGSPLVLTTAAYVVGIVSCLALIPLVPGQPSVSASLRTLGWSPVLVGGGVVCVELGFLLAYRAGLPLSTAALTASVLVAVVLLPIGLLAFHEGFSLARGAGVLCCLVGLWLVSGRA
jgi:drug/metabolite transporter (DMT)-like permease